MKKVISVFLICCFLSVFCVCTVNAEESGIIKINSIYGAKNQIVEVPIYIENNPGIIAMRLFVEYDESKAVLTGCENGDVFEKSSVSFSDKYKSPFVFLYEDGLAKEENRKNGTAFVLYFKLLTDIKNESFLSIRLDSESTFNVSLDNVPFAFLDKNSSTQTEKSIPTHISESISESSIKTETRKSESSENNSAAKATSKNSASSMSDADKIVDNGKKSVIISDNNSKKTIVVAFVLLVFLLLILIFVKIKRKKGT